MSVPSCCITLIRHYDPLPQATAIINRTLLSQPFCMDVRNKILEMLSEDEAISLLGGGAGAIYG